MGFIIPIVVVMEMIKGLRETVEATARKVDVEERVDEDEGVGWIEDDLFLLPFG